MVRMIGGPQGPGRCLRCLRRSAEGTGYRPPTRGGVVGFCFVNFWPSSGIAQGTIRRGGACCKRTGTCEGWPPGPRKVWQMLWAFGRGHGVSIPHQRRGNWPLFRQLLILWVYRPGHKRRGRRLLQTDLVRVRGVPKAERCGRCFRHSAEGTCRRSRTRGGVIGPYLG